MWWLILVLACGGAKKEDTDLSSTVDSTAPSIDTSSEDDTDDTSGSPDCTVDADKDGVNACEDCDDNDPRRFPGAPEICDGLDNDCDGELAEGEEDLDGDGEPDCTTCDLAGFWGPTRGLEGDALVDRLVQLVDPHWCDSYSTATAFMFLELDKEAATSEVECVYTGRRLVVGDSKPDGNDMNTEHSWPQSQGAGSIPARCDLHHLYPTDSNANSRRSNHPFGVVTQDVTWEQGGSKLGKDAAGRTVFEPRDAHKGNVARSMLYFAYQYGHTLTAQQLALYRSWHLADPPDDRERERSFRIAREQVVANPFVTCPEMVDAL